MNNDREVNIIIQNEYLDLDLDIKLFEPLPEGEVIHYISDDMDMYDILVKFGFFPSKKECRRNWTKSGVDVPDGWNEFRSIGKMKRNLYIFKPMKISNVDL